MVFQPLRGLIAAPFTPMHPDGSLHLEMIPAYFDLLLANGVAGAFICGSTGEGVSLTLQEKKLVAEAWAACAKHHPAFTVMTLLGGNCLAECKELALHAKEVGLDAVSFTAPSYFKPASLQILANCCKEIAEAVPDMPFYYYHIPVLTGVHFSMYDLLQTVDGLIPNFVGIKYTHEDFMDFQSCMHFKEGKYNMLWGRDENLLPSLSLGARGAVGSTYNYAAPLYHAIMDAYHQGNLEKAARLQQQAIDMIRLLGKYGGMATGKAFMKLIGFDCGEFRLPIKNMSSTEFTAFQQDAAGLQFQSYCSQLPVTSSAE